MLIMEPWLKIAVLMSKLLDVRTLCNFVMNGHVYIEDALSIWTNLGKYL